MFLLLTTCLAASMVGPLKPSVPHAPATGKGPITAGAKFETIRAKQDAIADRDRVLDQKTEYFLGMPPGPERELFAKQLLKEIEELRAENAKLAPALKNLMKALEPKKADDR